MNNKIVKLAKKMEESTALDFLAGAFSLLTSDEVKKAKAILVSAQRTGLSVDDFLATVEDENDLSPEEKKAIDLMRFVFITDTMGRRAAIAFARGNGYSVSQMDSLVAKKDIPVSSSWCFVLAPATVKLMDEGFVARAKLALIEMLSFSLQNPGSVIDVEQLSDTTLKIASISSDADDVEKSADGEAGFSTVTRWIKSFYDASFDENTDDTIKDIIAVDPTDAKSYSTSMKNVRQSLGDASVMSSIAEKISGRL